MGFRYKGGKGSHRIYSKEGVKEILNFQEVNGKVKPSQIRQLLPECSAFGRTEIEALREIKTAIAFWVRAAEKEGKEIPHPLGKPFLSKAKELWPEIVEKAGSPG